MINDKLCKKMEFQSHLKSDFSVKMNIIFLPVLQVIILIWITQVPLCQTSLCVTTGKQGRFNKRTWWMIPVKKSPTKVLLINNYSCILFSNKIRGKETQENVDNSAIILNLEHSGMGEKCTLLFLFQLIVFSQQQSYTVPSMISVEHPIVFLLIFLYILGTLYSNFLALL